MGIFAIKHLASISPLLKGSLQHKYMPGTYHCVFSTDHVKHNPFSDDDLNPTLNLILHTKYYQTLSTSYGSSEL